MTPYKISVGETNLGADLQLCPSKNLYTGLQYFEKEFGVADSLEEDMLNLASGVYAADLAVIRDERENFLRTIELTVEVVNFHAFERIKDKLSSALLILSRDNWHIKFVQKTGTPVANFQWQNKEGAALLFSGGIDSMCAASDFINKKTDLVLVSHNTHANKVVDKSQKNVHKALQDFYKTKVRHIHIKVYGRKNSTHSFPEANKRENTQRTRSFLFLSLAALITRRCGFNKVLYMAENGQFAIHLPLNSARVGPFSTHTADPNFVTHAQEIFRTVLSNPVFEISNPFLYKTKAEVFAVMPNKLQKEVQNSASCWMISHVPQEKHCGICIPCISRRIAIEYNGLKVNEYHTDIFTTDINTLADDNTGKRNLIDYLEFIIRFKEVTAQNKDELICEFPELINPSIDEDQALKLFERVSQQSFKVFQSYPKVISIIK
ncbi:MAG: 7-cyano-7-deazaguanine synthase [Bacteroidota bacterium]|nr:7-cyano-7-deazaguanine synthase [Bacteroidota bacterium]